MCSLCASLLAPLSGCGADPSRNEQIEPIDEADAAVTEAPNGPVSTTPDAARGPDVTVKPSLDAATMQPSGNAVVDATLPNVPTTSVPMADAAVPGPEAGAPEPTSYPALQPAQVGMPTLLAKGFTLAESPTWDPCGQRLIVTDPTLNTISEISPAGQVSVLLTDTNYTNGITYDRDGSLLMAQMGNNNGGRVARLDRSGAVTVLVDKNTRAGRFHTVDDVVVRSDGTLYFSDGDFSHADHTTLILTPTPLYLLKPGPDPRTLVAGPSVSGPNGVELSPDEKTLYLSAYFSDAVVRYDVAPDGTLSKGATFAGALGSADSLCLDAAGNVYVGVAGGLQILRPDGSRLKNIPIAPSNKVTNCTFGGPAGTTLFFTAWTEVWKVDDMPIPGLDWTLNKRIDCTTPLPPRHP